MHKMFHKVWHSREKITVFQNNNNNKKGPILFFKKRFYFVFNTPGDRKNIRLSLSGNTCLVVEFLPVTVMKYSDQVWLGKEGFT